MLLTALRDRDTVVRWSGAKGLARVTARLPQTLGTDVIDCVLDLFGAAGDGTVLPSPLLKLLERSLTDEQACWTPHDVAVHRLMAVTCPVTDFA